MSKTSYTLGGVSAARPFKLRRLGHIAIDVADAGAALGFYARDLGLQLTDSINTRVIPGMEALAASLPDPNAYFLSNGHDHHTVVLSPRPIALARRGEQTPANVTNGQISFQVSSLRELLDAKAYLEARGIVVPRFSRDMPGSNWHIYFTGPDHLTVEFYYGMEQIGWDGRSKPTSMYYQGIKTMPELPYRPEFDEVNEALERDLDIGAGHRQPRGLAQRHDVDGVALPRPFRIHRLGPVGFFSADVEAAARFYTEVVGLRQTEEVEIEGERCVFLRSGSEHHSLALYPVALRAKLGITRDSTNFFTGFQVGNYSQLRAAGHFLRERGWQVGATPWPLAHPGVDRALYATDPDGNRVLLYYYMEQLGWDGLPSQRHTKEAQDFDAWPHSVEAPADVFCDAPLLGPLG